VNTPYFYIDEALLVRNLETLRSVIERTGCKILLAQKAFSMFALYPLIGKYLHGTTASGLFEAKLGYEAMGLENHVFSPAYAEHEIGEILSICGYVVFNSFHQWIQYKDRALAAGVSCGLRVNPEKSTQGHGIYDPCSPGSRLGVTLANFQPELLDGIEGLHFHTLCEQNADALAVTWEAVEAKFGKYLRGMKWLNIGGGHHITRPDYDIGRLAAIVNGIQTKYGLQVYIEPGEAVVLNTGFLIASVLDIVENGGVKNAILDASAACHMPDVLEMPYQPEVAGAVALGRPPLIADDRGRSSPQNVYRLGGPTCLAGDVIGDYSFDAPLRRGDTLTFCDMAHYSMVKANSFNGMPLPSIAVKRQNGELEPVRRFGYDDFKGRLS
jgi:carboxynorspermidine decarboxylase